MSFKKHIPNAITSMNLICGSLGVIASFNGRPDIAFILMLSAAAFDYCDGLSARIMGAYSDVGKELDSLSDDISFGFLPAVMLHNAMVSLGCGIVWSCIPVVLAVFSALRLAKFNVDPRQHTSFIGVPTPPSAMICGALGCFIYSEPDSIVTLWCSHCWVLPLLAVVLSFLLVSWIPMFAFKLGKGQKADPASLKKLRVFIVAILASILATLVLGVNWSLAVLLSFIFYIFINLF